MIKVENVCCGRYSLRTRSIIIGAIILFAGVVGASMATLGLSGEEYRDFATFRMFNVTDIDVESSTEEDEDSKETNAGIKWINGLRTEVTKNQVTIFLVVQLILGLLDILAASILLLGICQFKPIFVIPILIHIPVGSAVVWITHLTVAGFNVWFFSALALTILRAYYGVCLFSFWLEQKEDMKPEPV